MSGNFNLADYATVDERIDKYWQAHPKPEGSIQTEIIWVSNDGNSVAIKATVYQGDRILATGIAQEERLSGLDKWGKPAKGANTSSWWENCETSAIGRALANMGMSLSKRASREEMQKVQRYADRREDMDEGDEDAEHARPQPPAGRDAPAFTRPRQDAPAKPVEAMSMAEVEREIAPLEKQVRRNDDALSNGEYARYHALDARRKALLAFTPRQDAPATQPQAPPAPRPYTEAEFGGVLDAAWGLAEDGRPLAEIRDYLNKLRHRMSKAQHEDARAALVRIEAQYYAPAAVAG